MFKKSHKKQETDELKDLNNDYPIIYDFNENNENIKKMNKWRRILVIATIGSFVQLFLFYFSYIFYGVSIKSIFLQSFLWVSWMCFCYFRFKRYEKRII